MTPAGDWLLGTAYLAPIPDLTKVPPAPLMSLLATNDARVGMSFGYNGDESRLVLNATIPTRGMDAGSLKNLVEGMKGTIRRTEGLWDARKW
ncbi:MAG: hypothetical protein K0Q72_5440 [Armatimonadetes bacterium]|nr:hypothetical protein [Armatimonadota bacterium]